ncbi:MAG: aromatic ring-opening dioxygenase subunit LigB [Chloroflexota bacterium]|nr:aromatic ring-opening dioxygenase subunit LigB [Chloroflexota bacterium]
MSFVFAAIAPHGFPIIPALSDDAEGGLATRNAMLELGKLCAAARPDVIVVAGPHGVRVDGSICLADVSRGAGILHWQGRTVEMSVPVDLALTDRIASAARAREIPIALAGYAGNRRSQSAIPLDWGVITPLWFLGHNHDQTGHGDVLAEPPATDPGPPVVIVTPSRSLPRIAMVEFGRAIADAATEETRRIAFVASCDWAHTHREDGPYGFHPAAAEVDAIVVEAVKDGDLLRLLDLEQAKVDAAAIDGLWQTLMLAGAIEQVPMQTELLSYEAPSYYGMLVAAYQPSAR